MTDDIRPCPTCSEPVDITDWDAMEANECDSCGAALTVQINGELIAVPWSRVEF